MDNSPENKAESLGTEKISKLLFRLAMPAITAQIINLLYNLVDRMYIGHIEGIGKLALTGVGVCLPLIMIISAFAALISMGSAPRASIFLGKGDKESAEKTLGNSFILLIIVSLVLTVIFQFFSRGMLMAFGASENTIQYAVDYMLIYSLGTLFVQLTLGMNAFISAQGFAKVSMLTVLIGAVSNIILDPVFIFVFNMGVKGAAIATIISQAISMVWILRFLTGRKTVLHIKKKYLRLDPKVFLPCIALGLAPFIMQSTESLLSVCFNSSLLKYGGDLAVGAMTILASIMQFTLLPLMGLGQGAQPIISYNFGAGNAGRVKKAFKLLLICSVVYSTLLWAAVQLFPKIFIVIFNNDAALLEYTERAIRIYMAVAIVMGVQLACQQSFIALGDAKSSLAAALMRKIIILIPMIYIMPTLGIFDEKDIAVFWAEPVSDFLAVTFTSILFFFQFRKSIKSIEKDRPDEPGDKYRQSWLYRFLRRAVLIFTKPMKTLWSSPMEEGPAIFICNHDRAYGPVAMCAHFDQSENVRPWINSEVLSAKTLVPYVREDYWWPHGRWYTPILDHTLAYIYALILPPILRGSGCIPVYHDSKVMSTLRGSVGALDSGRHIVLFPEHPTGYCQYASDVFDGFVSLGRLLYRRKQKLACFYPVFVDWHGKEIRVGQPIRYDPQADFKLQTRNISDAVEKHFQNNGLKSN